MLSSLPAAGYPEACEDERGCGFAVSFWLYLPSLVTAEAGTGTSATAACAGSAATAYTVAATAGNSKEAESSSEWRICCRQVEGFNTDGETDDASDNSNNNVSSSSSCHPDVRLTDTPEHGLQIQFSVMSRGNSGNSTAVTATSASAAAATTVAGGGQHSYTAHKLTSICGLPRDEWVHVCCVYDLAPAAAAAVDSATNADDAATGTAAHSMSLCINGATVAQHSVSTTVAASSASSTGNRSSTVYQPVQCCSLQTGCSTTNTTDSSNAASSCSPMLCDLSWHSKRVTVGQVREVAAAGPVGVRATEVTAAQCYCSRLTMLTLSLAHRSNSSSSTNSSSSSSSISSYYRSSEWLTLWLQLLPLAGAYAQRCIVSLLQQRLLEHTADANTASDEAVDSSAREGTVRTLCELLGKRVLRFAYEDSAAVCDDVYLSSSSSCSSYSNINASTSSTAAAAAVAAQQQYGFCLTSELTSLLRGLLALPSASLWRSAASSVLQGAVSCSKLGAADGYTAVGHTALPLACAAVCIAGGQVPVLCTGALVAVPADSCTALQCCALGSVQHFYAGAELPVSAAVALHDSSCLRDAVRAQPAAQPLNADLSAATSTSTGTTSTTAAAAAADTAAVVMLTLPVDTLVLTAAAPLPAAPYVHTVSALQLLTGLLQSYPALPRSAHSSVSPLRAAGSAALSPPARSLAAAAVATLDDALAASHLRTRLLRALTAQLTSARAIATASSNSSSSSSAQATAAAAAAAAAAVVQSTELLHALLLLAASDVAAAPTAALRGDAGAAAALMPAVAAFGAALSAGGVHGVCGAAALQQASQVNKHASCSLCCTRRC
jgi:trimeric autotransporter adhesin